PTPSPAATPRRPTPSPSSRSPTPAPPPRSPACCGPRATTPSGRTGSGPRSGHPFDFSAIVHTLVCTIAEKSLPLCADGLHDPLLRTRAVEVDHRPARPSEGGVPLGVVRDDIRVFVIAAVVLEAELDVEVADIDE